MYWCRPTHINKKYIYSAPCGFCADSPVGNHIFSGNDDSGAEIKAALDRLGWRRSRNSTTITYATCQHCDEDKDFVVV